MDKSLISSWIFTKSQSISPQNTFYNKGQSPYSGDTGRVHLTQMMS